MYCKYTHLTYLRGRVPTYLLTYEEEYLSTYLPTRKTTYNENLPEAGLARGTHHERERESLCDSVDESPQLL